MTKLEKTIEAYRASGRVAFHYPRKNMVSLDGGKLLPVKDAIAKMCECLSKVA